MANRFAGAVNKFKFLQGVFSTLLNENGCNEIHRRREGIRPGLRDLHHLLAVVGGELSDILGSIHLKSIKVVRGHLSDFFLIFTLNQYLHADSNGANKKSLSFLVFKLSSFENVFFSFCRSSGVHLFF